MKCLCGCGAEAVKSYVQGHNQRGKTFVNRRRQPFEARFWSKVDKNAAVPIEAPHLGNCWRWTGNHNSAGYGMIFPGTDAQARMVLAHRVSYELAHGPIPEGYDIDHLCRVTDCLRVEHLEAVPHSVNIQRGFDRKRARLLAVKE